ncbi:MAG: peptidoglycan-binding protein [bacterium]|nr:peptidoglycan-binding protein [bacterium]
MTITSSRKIVAGLLSFAMVLTLVAGVTVSTADAQTSITGASHVYTRNLTVGNRGADVSALQQVLHNGGFLSVTPTGYFGPLTKAALGAWQASVGIAPAAGYFGPITRAYLANMGGTPGPVTGTPGCPAGAMYNYMTGAKCTTTPGTPTPPATDALRGTDGSISDVNELSQYNNEEVGENQKDVKVLGFEVETTNDGDIALRSIKVSFDPAGNGTGDSDDLEDYISRVKVWKGSTMVGSADADDFSEDSNDIWTRTITLTNSVVRADDTEQFVISVDGVNSLDSGDIDSDSWTVDVENIRFVDGSGVTTTETGYDLDGMDVGIDFVTFSASADTKLKITTDSSSPEAGIVVVDDSDNTDDIVLLKGKIEVEGNSDVTIDELPITFTSTGAAVASTTGTVKLKIGSKNVSETMSITVGATTGTVTFDNLDFDISAGQTVSFTVLANINDIEANDFDEGDTLTASLTASNREVMDVENEENDQLTSSEKSGTATGEAQEFRTNGVSVSLVSATTAVTSGNSANDDTGTFTIKFKVTAVGDTVYVSTLADATTSGVTSGKTSVVVDRAGTATVGGVSAVLINTTDTDLNAAGLYEIEEGESETFELTASAQLPAAGSSGLYRAVLGGISWTTDGTDATPNNTYTSNLDTFKTSYVSLN